MNFRNIAISFGLLTMVGCKNIFEDNDLTLDGSNPYNTIDAPSANNVYRAGEDFKLKTKFVDKDNVELIDVKVTRLASDARGSSNVINFQRSPMVNQYVLDTAFAANLFTPGNYQLIIRSVDTRKNEGTKEVKFSVQ
ncbi:MAG TPA: hypothetical protein VK927_08385 [Adhaeribacter sp.]|nr:hypothetical protein [Adhaeribacter sp.]